MIEILRNELWRKNSNLFSIVRNIIVLAILLYCISILSKI